MVMAGDTSPLITSQVSWGICAPGNWLEIEKRSPMVSMEVMPAYCLSNRAAMVIKMMAIRLPGNFFNRSLLCDNRGQRAMTITEPIPTAALQMSVVGKALI